MNFFPIPKWVINLERYRCKSHSVSERNLVWEHEPRIWINLSSQCLSLYNYVMLLYRDYGTFKGIAAYELGLGIGSFQKNSTFLRSFSFFSKERNVLALFCVLYKRNETFFAFFYILYKRTWRSLRSFTFFIKERKRTLHSFWFHKSYKNDRISQKKERKRTVRSFLSLKKNFLFCNIYLYKYIFI